MKSEFKIYEGYRISKINHLSLLFKKACKGSLIPIIILITPVAGLCLTITYSLGLTQTWTVFAGLGAIALIFIATLIIFYAEKNAAKKELIAHVVVDHLQLALMCKSFSRAYAIILILISAYLLIR